MGSLFWGPLGGGSLPAPGGDAFQEGFPKRYVGDPKFGENPRGFYGALQFKPLKNRVWGNFSPIRGG